MRSRLGTAIMAAAVCLALPTTGLAGGEWPDGPNKAWFQGLQRPDNHKNLHRDPKSRFCCGVADTVKTTSSPISTLNFRKTDGTPG